MTSNTDEITEFLYKYRQALLDGRDPPDPRSFCDRLPEIERQSLRRCLELINEKVRDSSPGPDPQIPGYEILSRLGRGGNGVVYKARLLFSGQLDAIKVLHADFTERSGAPERLRREARSMARLRHDHIVRIHGGGEVSGRPYIVMEFIEGVDLCQLVEEEGPIAPSRAADYICQVARGLEHAHAKGVVHRDLKPSNLMRMPSGRVKILDFGMARLIEFAGSAPPLTRTGDVVGTIGYMPREQREAAHRVGISADIYALGCTFYHLLAGQPPMLTDSPVPWSSVGGNQAPPPIEDLCPDIDPGLSAILRRMMDEGSDDRYQSATEVLAALLPFTTTFSAPRAPVARALVTSPPRDSGLAPDDSWAADSAGFPERQRKSAWSGRLSRWVTILGAALVASLVVIPLWAMAWRFRSGDAPDQRKGVPVIPLGLASESSSSLRVIRFEIRHFPKVDAKHYDRRRSGILGRSSSAAFEDDDVTIRAELSEPAYAYLIAFRPDGTEELCHPDKEDTPPPRTKEPMYPPPERSNKRYRLSEGAGLYAFALVVSREEPPSYRHWRQRAGPSPWIAKLPYEPGNVWLDDDQGLRILEADGAVNLRSKNADARDSGGATGALASWLRGRSGADDVVAVEAFPVEPASRP